MNKKHLLIVTTLITMFLYCNSMGQLKNINIDGDFRYRHEFFNQEDMDKFNRHQIRARLKLDASITEDVNIVVQIASGEGDSPFSTDQTLDGAFSSKKLWLDKAYASWKSSLIKGLCFVGGKAPNPLYRPNNNQLEWNPDVHMEGLSASFNSNNCNLEIFSTAFSYWMAQRAVGKDSWLIGAQVGLKYTTDIYNFSTGVGYHSYTNAKGNPTYYDVTNSFGNSVDSEGNYNYDFNLAEAFLEVAVSNISVYAEVILNTGTENENKSYIGGISYKVSDITFSYNYRKIEKDALIGVLNDPDFAGGVTDSKGHKANIAYRLSEKIVTDITYIHSKMGIDNGKYYRRLQLAMNFEF